MVLRTVSYSIINLLVDEDYDSPVLKKVIDDFPIESRRSIIKDKEIEIINEGKDIKFEPEYYLNMDCEVKSLSI